MTGNINGEFELAAAAEVTATGAATATAGASAAVAAAVVELANVFPPPLALGTAVHRRPLILVIEKPAGRADVDMAKATRTVSKKGKSKNSQRT